jgi:hypothetical protein
MEMNDKTILRIKVPAHLYESVKAQLTLDEAKQNFGTKDMKAVKAKESSSGDKPKKTAAPKAKAPKVKKAEAPEMKDDAPHDGMNKIKKKARSLDELKAAYEAIGKMISEMEGDKEGKAPVEEAKENIKEYETAYRMIDGECYRVNDENEIVSGPHPSRMCR